MDGVNKNRPLWQTEVNVLASAAALLESEALTYAQGWAVQNADGSLNWDGAEEWAKIKHYRLTCTAQKLRDMIRKRR